MSHWIYAAILVAIAASLAGVAVGGMILRRVLRHREAPRPIVAWLLFVLLAMSLAQFVEQSRVLVFRLSYDGLIHPGLFDAIYGAAWNVVSSKVLMSVAIMSGAAVKLGLYCDRPDGQVARWGLSAAVVTVAAWVALALVLDGYL
jgi:hypothetical protein